MAFINWTVLYNAMLEKLAAGDTSVGEVSSGSKRIVYKSNKEFLEMLAFVEGKAKDESGTAVPRTYAGQGGRCTS